MCRLCNVIAYRYIWLENTQGLVSGYFIIFHQSHSFHHGFFTLSICRLFRTSLQGFRTGSTEVSGPVSGTRNLAPLPFDLTRARQISPCAKVTATPPSKQEPVTALGYRPRLSCWH
ncbi:hypothetical protein CI102_274 [Trichoderma harzianum]|nr:hypothetical protein CI102_274 [Trichoderma harzianum]